MFVNGICRAELNDIAGVVPEFLDSKRAFLTKIMSFVRLAARSLARPRLALVVPRIQPSIPWRAGFATAAGLTKENIEKRILDVLKEFEKVNASKVAPESTFDCTFLTIHIHSSLHERHHLQMTWDWTV